MSSFDEPLDLLGQRRLELGLPEDSQPPADARRLLLIGGLVGSALILVSLLAWLGLRLRQQMIEGELSRLSNVPTQLAQLESSLKESSARVAKIKNSNTRLANGLVSVRSGSALLTQLALIAPSGVQLTGVSVEAEGNLLRVKGLAADPEAFRRINAIQLQLSNSPLINPDEVEVVKVSREEVKLVNGVPGSPPAVRFDIAAGFSSAAEAANLAELRRLGADGLAERLQILKRQGVLP